MRITFGSFAFDPQSRLLWREGTEIALPPRVLGVLELLLERAGDVVARQDLLDRVWKDAFVTDTSLAEAVSFLRSALGDDPQSPRYIQTVHRRGYRFLVTPVPGLTPAPPEPTDRGQSAAADTHGDRPESPSWELVPWSMTVLCAGLAAAAVWYAMKAPAPTEPPVARLELVVTPGTAFDRDLQPIALSPDGRSIAWSACDGTSGRCSIYVRALDALDARALPGTDGAQSPVFSPDGRWIAFFADGALKKIGAAGGTPTTLASAPSPAGAAWADDGRIAFAGSAAGGLAIVNAQGGPVQPLTRPRAERGELRHRDPAWLPDGTLLFTIASAPDAATPGELAAIQPRSQDIRVLRAGVTRALPAGRGYLLLATGADLQAATFDDRALVLTGPTDALPAPASAGVPRFAAVPSALAIVRSVRPPERVWRDGVNAGPLARLASITIAPDSRRASGIAVDSGGSDVWIVDLVANVPTRLTFGGTNVSPVWSADSQRIFFAARDAQGVYHVMSRDTANRNAPAMAIPSAPAQAFPSSAAADGRVALTVYRDGRTAVAVIPAGGGAPRVLTDGPFDEAAAAFSPDGRWLALESNETGRTEVMVRSADGGRSFAVSTGGGSHPRWSSDGRSIYFDSGRYLMKAAFQTEAGGTTSKPWAVVDHLYERAVAVTPYGRVLVDRQPPDDAAVVTLQWLRELRERLPLPVNTPR